jgi:hypothetical protein
MPVRAHSSRIRFQAGMPTASPPSASTPSGTVASKPTAWSCANIDGVVSIKSMPYLAMVSTSASASR